MKAELDECTQEILGPKLERTRKRPIKTASDVFTGGTAYERSDHAKSVQHPARCYTLGLSVEAPTLIVAPVASAKLEGDEMDAHIVSRQRLLKVYMGFFGGAHTDDNDSPGAYSHMTCNSDLPDGYDPGFFFILQLGVFVVLKKYQSVNFNGRRRHGGTPPIGIFGEKLSAWAYRFVIIAYPPQRIVSGTGRLSLAALPNNEAAVTSRATFVREGVIMMLHMSLVTFLVRALLCFCHYVALQAPAEYKIQIDADTFIQAFTTLKDGHRVNTGPWALAPGWRRRDDQRPWVFEHQWTLEDQDSARSEAFARWDAYEAKVAMHIPSVGHKGPLSDRAPVPEKLVKPRKPCTYCTFVPPVINLSDSGVFSRSQSAAKTKTKKTKKERCKARCGRDRRLWSPKRG
ncbi:hypothetical protein B0H11DRAFT_1747702 [Mycena galericulata]|nr:hypothetical protein B0H11DRAFT_1747702 [Mycena galericulata]